MKRRWAGYEKAVKGVTCDSQGQDYAMKVIILTVSSTVIPARSELLAY
jgi:hypothetical protein